MWIVEFSNAAIEDIKKMDNSQRIVVLKAIRKVALNPLPQTEGGYGKPLGNKAGNDLTGYFKIKFKKIGIRVVYKIVREKDIMRIIVVSTRTDDECYNVAQKRIGQ